MTNGRSSGAARRAASTAVAGAPIGIRSGNGLTSAASATARATSDALQLVGDRWALLALREVGFGVTRFNEMQVRTGAPRASLAARLRALEDGGLLERRRYSEHPPRDEYLLTDAGQALMPILGQLRAWGEKYASPVVRP